MENEPKIEEQAEETNAIGTVVMVVGTAIVVGLLAYTVFNTIQLCRMMYGKVRVVTIDTDWMKERVEEIKKETEQK